MTMIWKKLLKVSLALIAGIVILGAAYVIPVLSTEIDPNLGKPECPGGKDWDQPGSSCHDGIISDIWPTRESSDKELVPLKRKPASAKGKKGH